MFSAKNYLKLGIGGIVLFLMIVSSHHDLLAQYFPHGIYNFDVRGPEYLFTEDEYNHVINLHANYLSEMSPRAQDGMVDSCNNFSGTMRIQLSSDPTYDYLHPELGPNYPSDNFPINTLLWVYICDNTNIANIKYNLIKQFIENVHTTYATNFTGIDAIRVAHQGLTDDPDHWPFIKYAGHWIQDYFGDAVKSVAIHNVVYWTGSRLQDFFSYMGDSLDVYQHEYYPFFDTDPAGFPYMGDDFQNRLDEGYIASCDSTRMHLIRSGNTHTTLEMHIQTFEALYGATYFRRPTQAEIWLQAFLALSRGFKGIHSYVYRSHDWPYTDDYETGLIDATTRSPIQPTYGYVAKLYSHLDSLGPALLPLEAHNVFTWTGDRYKYIKNITGDTLDGSHKTIEVCIFEPNNNFEHFMLINRRCNRNSSGVWVNAFPQYINVTLADSMSTGTYQIRDLSSNELYVASDKTFRNIKILAGRGRLFELRKLFSQNETWSGTVNVSSNITVPTGKTLTIAEKSILKFYANTQLIANGTLTAVGFPADSITFTSDKSNPAAGNWKGIRLASGSSASVLNYCNVFYTTKGISIDYASPTIQYNTIRYFTEQGIYTNKNASPQILDNLITNGGLQGIYHVNNGGTPIIKNNIIGADGDQMTYGFERFNGKNSTTTFENNMIRYTNNSGAAIKVSYAKVVFVNNTITNNLGHGIWIRTRGNPDIHDNDINDNGKSGIYVERGSPTNIKWNNILRNQLHGIHFLRTCDSKYFKNMMQNTWNNIYGNSDSEINNQQKTANLMAENQFWDLYDKNSIQNEMKGKVDFDPWQTTANPDAGPRGGIGKFITEELLPPENLVSLPQEFLLNQNFPNPFNPETVLAYTLPTQAHVALKIFNMLGEEIMTLCGNQQPAGLYQLTWNGKNKFGEAVPSGVYFYRLEAQPSDKTWTSFVATRKMVFVK